MGAVSPISFQCRPSALRDVAVGCGISCVILTVLLSQFLLWRPPIGVLVPLWALIILNVLGTSQWSARLLRFPHTVTMTEHHLALRSLVGRRLIEWRALRDVCIHTEGSSIRGLPRHRIAIRASWRTIHIRGWYFTSTDVASMIDVVESVCHAYSIPLRHVQGRCGRRWTDDRSEPGDPSMPLAPPSKGLTSAAPLQVHRDERGRARTWQAVGRAVALFTIGVLGFGVGFSISVQPDLPLLIRSVAFAAGLCAMMAAGLGAMQVTGLITGYLQHRWHRWRRSQ